jgi:hypothetical protein
MDTNGQQPLNHAPLNRVQGAGGELVIVRVGHCGNVALGVRAGPPVVHHRFAVEGVVIGRIRGVVQVERVVAVVAVVVAATMVVSRLVRVFMILRDNVRSIRFHPLPNKLPQFLSALMNEKDAIRLVR